MLPVSYELGFKLAQKALFLRLKLLLAGCKSFLGTEVFTTYTIFNWNAALSKIIDMTLIQSSQDYGIKKLLFGR